MKKNTIYLAATPVLLGLMLVAPGITPALAQRNPEAQNNAASSTQAAELLQERMQNLKDRADREIDRRIAKLNTLRDRIQAMKRISEDDQQDLMNGLQGQIDSLNALKAKIDADTELETLRVDVQSVTKSYRIFALIIPQAAVIAAADRVLLIADNMDVLREKLVARINEVREDGGDVSAMQQALDDYDAKLADARENAEAAIAAVKDLTPDGGDRSQLQENMKALQDARAKIRKANEDLRAARKDAGAIVKAVKGLHRVSSTSRRAVPNENSSAPTSSDGEESE